MIGLKKINIEGLVLEITRECNMKCSHCLRGDQWGHVCGYDMGYDAHGNPSTEILSRIFDNIQSIDCITFSGGEPTLNVPFIVNTIDYIIDNDINVAGVYIVTNGKEYSQEMVDAVRKLQHHYIESTFGDRSSYLDIERISRMMNRSDIPVSEVIGGSFTISVSVDKFHEEIPVQNYIKYRTCGLYSEEHEFLEERHLVLRGRAERNDLKGYYRDPREIYFSCNDEDETTVELVYVDVNGNVYGDCDLSYDMMDDGRSAGVAKYGNIWESSLYDVISEASDNEMEED